MFGRKKQTESPALPMAQTVPRGFGGSASLLSAAAQSRAERVLYGALREAVPLIDAAPLIVAHVDVTRFVTYEDPDGYMHTAPIDIDLAIGEAQLSAVTSAAASRRA